MNAAPSPSYSRPQKSARPAFAAPWRWALAGALAGLALMLAINAPARWLAHALERASGGAVRLAEPQGSVWSGSAQLVLTGGVGSRDSAALPGRVRWQLWPALTGLRARVSADCCTPSGPLALRASLRWGGARVALADGQSLWPAALLAGLGTPWNTILPQGELTLTTRNLQLEWAAGRFALQGHAEVTARHLRSRLSTLEPLGSYRLELRGGDAVALELTTLEGGLQLSGSGQWVGARLHFSGEARAAAGLQTQLANLLNLIGRRQEDKAIISLG
ncbi:MAG: type II secretion system protein N [Burkholderiaceae bacterium]|jgi:general secretion pathway protein N|nr:type II secretion system protein N [Burkholderiaceae bacterium]